MKRIIYNIALFTTLKFVVAEDVEFKTLKNPEYAEEAVMDLDSYKKSGKNGRSSLGDVEYLEKSQNEKYEEPKARSNVNILLYRSSKDNEFDLLNTDEIVTLNKRYMDDNNESDLVGTDGISDKADRNSDLKTGKNIEPYNVLIDTEENTNQDKTGDKNEYILDVPSYPDDIEEIVSNDDLYDFDRSRNGNIIPNNRRMLNPFPVLPMVHTSEYSISPTLRSSNYDSHDNYYVTEPSFTRKLQPLPSAYNVYNSPVNTKPQVNPTLINTFPRQNTNTYYNSYNPAALQKRVLYVPSSNRVHSSYEDSTDRSGERTYQFNSYFQSTPPFPPFKNMNMLGRAPDLSYATYRPVPDYTQTLNPFNQRYSNVKFEQYSLTRYQRDVTPEKVTFLY